MDATLAIASTYNYLLSQYSFPEEVRRRIEEGLSKLAGKPWREAATLAFEHAKALVADFGEEEEDEDEEDEDEDEDEGADDEDEDGDE